MRPIVEVGGKRNLAPFAELAVSLGIPVGIVYDLDSSGLKGGDDEVQLNARLDSFARPDLSVRVWRLSPNYEAELRRELGEPRYQHLCQQFPNIAKPTRARLIAADQGTAIPKPFTEVLSWLAGNPPQTGG